MEIQFLIFEEKSVHT